MTHAMNDDERKVREALIDFLDRPRTHAPLKKAAADITERSMNEKAPGVPHTAWALLEHVRITAHDMLEFIRNEHYEPLDWPEEYWPREDEKATSEMWEASVKMCEKDRAEFKKIVEDPATDLFDPIPWGEGQTVFREVMQMIDHTAYHVGELVLLRRALGDWKEE